MPWSNSSTRSWGGERALGRGRRGGGRWSPERPPRGLLLLCLLLAGAAGGAAFLLKIERIDVLGARAAQPRLLQEALEPAWGKRLMSKGLGDLAAAVLADPWVRSVEFRRRLPDRLVVMLHESQPAFALLGGGAVDGEGRFLPPRAGVDITALPVLSVEGVEPADGEFSEIALAAVRRLHAVLSRSPWTWGNGLEHVEIDARGDVELVSRQGVRVVLGRDDWDRRLTALAAVAERLGPGPGDRIDLRFERQVVHTPAAQAAESAGG